MKRLAIIRAGCAIVVLSWTVVMVVFVHVFVKKNVSKVYKKKKTYQARDTDVYLRLKPLPSSLYPSISNCHLNSSRNIIYVAHKKITRNIYLVSK